MTALKSLKDTVRHGSVRRMAAELCVLRTFGNDGEFNTCPQSVPRKCRDRLGADENQWNLGTPKRAQYAQFSK